MKKVSVLGAGMVGSAIARDLSKNFEVTSYDFSQENLDFLSQFNIKTVNLDLNKKENIKKAVQFSDLVVNATPGFMGYATLKEILINKKNVIDIAFFPENSLELDTLAKENNVTAIVDIGVAPGISNFLIGHHNRLMEVDTFKCYVGGLPIIREYPFQYKAPFSPIDVIEEYTRPARFVENSLLVTKEALTDREYLQFDGIGTLEAFNSDGLRTIIDTIKAPKMIEKTLRYPGHLDAILMLKNSGFLDNQTINYNGNEINILDFTSKILFDKWKLNRYDEEFTVMKIIISGKENGQNMTYIYDLFDTTDKENQISSMARTTGYTACAALNLLNVGLFKNKGLFPPELIAINNDIYKYIFNYLEERKVYYKVNIQYN